MTRTADFDVAAPSWRDTEFFPARPVGAGGGWSHGLMALGRTVEVEIVPRLVRVHKRPFDGAWNMRPDGEIADDICEFAHLVLHEDVDVICAAVEARRTDGVTLEEVYLTLLAPTARYLREMWMTDACDFAGATLALWRLQQVLREFSVAFRSEFVHQEHGLRVLLAPAPGERHEIAYAMFGLALIAEFFRRDGWDAWIEPDSSSDEFADAIANQWFDVAEFLICGDKNPALLAAGIRNVRKSSPNRSLGVIVCGPPFIDNPELVLLVGADCPAVGTKQSAPHARSLVELIGHHC